MKDEILLLIKIPCHEGAPCLYYEIPSKCISVELVRCIDNEIAERIEDFGIETEGDYTECNYQDIVEKVLEAHGITFHKPEPDYTIII